MTIYNVTSGQTSSGLTLTSGDSEYVSSGGSAVSTTDGGDLRVYLGGTAVSTTVISGVQMQVDGGVASFTVVSSGTQDVLDYGRTISTTVSSGGYENVSYGDTTTGTTIWTGGYEMVSSGGSAVSTTVNRLGDLEVSSGGTTISTTVSSGGQQTVFSGGRASNTTVGAGGAEYLSGGITVYTTVNSGGFEVIYSLGSGLNTTVNAGGGLEVDSGGVASNATVTGAAAFVLISGGSVVSTTLSAGGAEFVYAGGLARATTVDSSSREVLSGAIAIGAKVNSGGDQVVSSGGIASNTTVFGGGRMDVFSGAAAVSATLNGGDAYVSSGGTATATTVSSGGVAQVTSGASVTGTTVDSGGLVNDYAGGSAVSTTVNSGGFIEVMSGGSDVSATLSGGSATVYGVASDTTVGGGGTLTVSSGGTTVSTTVDVGGLLEAPGAMQSATTVNMGGVAYISGTAVGTTLLSGGTALVLGVASDTTVSGGGLFVSSGGTASGTELSGSGGLIMGSGATVVSTTVWKGATELVEGGTAISTTVESGGLEYISSGGTLGATTLNGGTLDVFGDVVSGASIAFTGVTAATLLLGQTAQMSGSVTGFAAGDTIELTGIAPASVSYTSGTLAIAGGQSFALSTAGAGETVQIGSDGSGGTALSLASATGPTLTTSGTVTYTGGGTAVALDSGATITDGNAVTGGEVWINGGFVLGDQIHFTSQSGITGTFDAATGTLTLSGSASAASWQTALDSITFGFSPSDGDPTQAGNSPSRTIDWQVSDAGGSSAVTSSTVITQLSSVLAYGATIDESGIVAASETVGPGGTLTLFNGGGTAVGSIDVGTSLSTGDFILGGGGTNVILDTVFGTYTSGITLLTNPTTIAGRGTVTNTAASGVAVNGPSGTNWTLTNNGVIEETTGTGVSLVAGGLVTNALDANIIAATGVYIGGGVGTLINYGSLVGNPSTGQAVYFADGGMVSNQAYAVISGAYGVKLGATGTVINTGLITNTSTGSLASGIYLHAGGAVTNQARGTIDGAVGIVSRSIVSSVVNDGSIVADGTSGPGVFLLSGGSVSNQSGGAITGASGVSLSIGSVTNAGTIDSSSSSTLDAGIAFFASGTVTNQSSGLITGHYGILGIGAPLTVTNAGSIQGSATSGSATGIVLDAGGTVGNSGSITGGAGIVFGGTSAASVIDSGSIIGTGGTAIAFAGGNDTLQFQPSSSVFVQGTVDGGGGTNTLAFLSGATTGTLTGSDASFNHFTQGTVDAGASWVLAGSNTFGTGVSLSVGGTVTDTGTLSNAGTLNGEVTLSGGLFTNQAGGLMQNAYLYGVSVASANSVANAGTISATSGYAIYFQGNGNVSNAAGGLITGLTGIRLAGSNASVVNLGSINASQAFHQSYAVYLRDGGTVTNGQSGDTTAAITGYDGIGIHGTAAGTVINAGTVIATYATMPAVYLSKGVVTNGAGTLTGALLQGGVVVNSGGTVTNYGSIDETNTEAGSGVLILTAGTLNNLGSSALIEGFAGVDLTGDGTIINAGTIASNQGTAGYAVQFSGSTDRLIVDPSSVFIGDVNGGSGASTMELASTASAGTIVGLGSSVTNFASLVFDAGAQWTVAGNDSANGLGTLGISGFTYGDTIDITNFAASSSSFNSNKLTLTSGASSITLNVSGTFGVSQFRLASDGAVGTDITLGPAVVTYDWTGASGDWQTATNWSSDVVPGTSANATIANTGSNTVTIGSTETVSVAGLTLSNGSTLLTDGGFTSTNGFYVNGASVSVASTGTISGSDGIRGTVSPAEVVNAGQITATGAATYAAGIYLTAGGAVTNLTGGVIRGHVGIYADAPLSVVNAGKIGGDDGVLVENASATIVNTGSIGSTYYPLTGHAYAGIYLQSGGLVSNQSGGTISGQLAIDVTGAAGTVSNAGSIDNAVLLRGGGAVSNQSGGTISGTLAGLGIVAISGGTGTVVNAGAITSLTPANPDAVYLGGGGTVTNQSLGSITGALGVYIGGTTGSVINAGVITGAMSNAYHGVMLGYGGYVTNQFGGSITGDSAVLVTGGVATVSNAGFIEGSYGVTLGAGGLVANASGGTISGSADAVKFASGYTNRLLIDPGAVFTGKVDGGNTIGAASVSTLELASGASAGTISRLGTQFVNFASIIIDSYANWSITGTNSIASGETMAIDYRGSPGVAGTLVNAGLIANASVGGLGVVSGGLVSNQSGGTITGSAAGFAVQAISAGTIINAGLISNANTGYGKGIYLVAGGSVTNLAGGTISGDIAVYGKNGGAITVVNAGAILETGTLNNGDGIVGNAAGSVSNQSGGTISGYNGIFFSGSGATLTNAGQIIGQAGGEGVHFGANGVLTNQAGGTISGGLGVLNAASVVNAGLLQGVGTTLGSGLGVSLHSAGSVTNQSGGTITGAVDGVLAVGGTVVNQVGGVISGGAYAVFFSSGYAGRLVVYNGASFTGTVDGGNAIGASSVSTLELASGSGVGTINGIGSSFVDFGAIVFDAGARWDIAGGDGAAALGGATISGFSYGDTIDLTNFAAVSRTFSSDALVLTNSAGSHATLHLPGTFTTGNIAISSDGSSGTDIQLQTGAAVLNYGTTIDEGGIVASTETVNAGGTLTLFNSGGTAVGTIDVGTTLSTGDFVLKSDGSGGTNVVLDTVFGTYASGVTLLTNPTTIAATAAVSGSASTGAAVYGAAGTSWTVVNDGQVSDTGSAGSGISLNGAGTVSNQSGGVISGAYGVKFAGAGTVVNTGLITNTSTGSLASGIYLHAGGAVTNQAGGTIAGAVGIVSRSIVSSVMNDGRIVADGPTGPGVFLLSGGSVSNQSGGAITGASGVSLSIGTVTNAGTIDSSSASTLEAGIAFFGTGTVSNQSSGLITGHYGILGIGAPLTVTNAGTIQGSATSGSATGIVLDAGGTVSNSGSITGGAGIVVSGTSAAAVTDSGAIIGAAGTAVALGAGNDTVQFQPSSSVFIQGAVDGGGGTNTLAFLSGASAGTLTGSNAEFINFTSGSVASGATWVLAGSETFGSGITLANSGSLSATGTLSNAGTINGNPLTLNGASFTNQAGGLVSGAAYGVLASSASTLVNDGSLAANTLNGEAVSFANGGVVSNQSAGSITGNTGVLLNGTAGTVFNSGAITGIPNSSGSYGVFLSHGGFVSNASSGTISGVTGAVGAAGAATVINAGSLGTSTSVVNSNGVYLRAGGVLTNQAGGVISAYRGVNVKGTVVTLVNAGAIGGSTTGFGYGVVLGAGGRITNQAGGTITGENALAFNPLAPGAVVTITNAGSIGGGTNGIGVYLSGAGTLTNLSGGVISGGTDAVKLRFGYTNRLVIDPGAVFSGTVDGGNAIGATSISTLELASGTSAGTLNGVGNQYIDFAQITLDAGAQWDIVSSYAGAALGGATVSGFAYGDTIDLTNFAAVSRTFSSDALVLTNSAGSHATLHLPGTFTTGNIAISSDGSSGTDIQLQTGAAVLNYGTTIDEGGIVASAETVNAGGTLTLFNSGGTAVGTIDVGTTLSTGDFVLKSDGSGGTNIVLDTVFGTYASGVTLLTNPTTIAATAAVSGSASTGAAVYGAAGTSWTVVNDGQVSDTGSAGSGISLNGAGTVSNQSGGVISGTFGVKAAGALTVVNAGQITGTTTGSSAGGVDLRKGGTITNTTGGTISAAVGILASNSAASVLNGGSIAGGTAGMGVDLEPGGDVTNQSGGVITGGGGVIIGYAGTVVNAGTIQGNAAVFTGYGVVLVHGGTVTNQAGGLIHGFYGVKDNSDSATVSNAGSIIGSNEGIRLEQGGQIGNQAGATISGSLYGARGDVGTLSIVNAGQIVDTGRGNFDAAAFLGGGGAVTNQAAGTIAGGIGIHAVSVPVSVLNAGHITGNATAGSGAGVLLSAGGTVTNSGTISGVSGIVTSGTSAASVIDSGTIVGTAGTAIAFAAGNDTLQFQPSSSVFIQGMVDGGSGTNTLEFLSGATTGTLTGGNADFVNFTGGTVDAGASWVLAGSNTFGAGVSLLVSGTLTDAGTLSNVGTLNGEVTLSGALFTNQASGLVQNAYLYGVSLASANTVANAGTISATSGYAIYFQGNGNVSNAVGGLITGLTGIRLAGSNASVVNLGSINASQAFPHSYAVYLRDGGSVTNGQSGDTSAAITGYDGVGIHTAAGTVTNTATVTATGTSAAAVDLANGGVVTNGSGTLTAALLQGAADGIHESNGTVTNYGTIQATNTSGASAGVQIDAGGTLSNLGSAALVQGYYGAKLTAGGTVLNAGTIASNQGSSGDAVVFGSGTDRLILDPGAVFIGNLLGGSGTSTMELASAASAGTITGFGASVTNFDTLVFDAGAQWTVAGNDSASGLGTLAITGFGFGDTIDVTNFGAVSRTFSSNALVLTDAGGAHTTLDVQGSFSTSQVQIGSDGGTGTDIWLQNLPSIGAGATATFTGGGSAVVLDGSISLSDTASTTLVSAEVAINSGSIAGDVLNYTSLTGLGIVGNYDTATGTLTLSGTASIQNYQSALDSITYSFSPSNGDPTGGGSDTSRGISWIVNDGSGQSPAVVSTVDVVHVAPSITAGATATFSGGGSAVVLDGGVVITDVDSGGTLTGATVAINSGSIAGDVLNYTSLSGLGIIGNYDSTTGTLTLSGTASIANYESALDSVTYSFSPSNGDPTGGGGDTSRGIAWSVNDGAVIGNVASSTLNEVHIAPSVAASGTVGFTPGGSAVVLDAGIAVSDPDSGGVLTSATVSIASGFLFGDLLNYTSLTGLGITRSYSASTGVLTLSGTSSVANYESALASITYSFSPGNGDPTGGGSDTSRGIAWQVSDGVAVSNTGSSVLSTVHAAPTITTGGTVTFTGGGSAVVLDGSVTVVDTNSGGALVGAVVAINSGFVTGDILNYTSITGSGITGSFDAATGTLTLSGTSSIANYESALESITYGFSPANGDPTGGGGDTSRSISWAVNDGVSGSNTGSSTLDTVHVAPTITASGTATFSGGGSAVVLDGSIAVTDVDSSGTLTGATVAINSGSIAGDVLNYASLSGLGITGSYDAATGTLTLSGASSIANYESALDSITYSFSPGNGDPTGAGGDTSRGISWLVNDGVANSNAGTSTVDTVHIAPTITAGGTVSFTGGGSAVVLDGSIAVTDVDSGGTLTGATVAINSGSIAGDVLNYASLTGLGITGSYDAATGTLTLGGASSIGNYESALDSVTYSFSPGGDPTGGGSHTSRSIAWSVNDGVAISNTASSALTDVHIAPSISASGTVGFAAGGGSVALDPGVLVSDPDSGGVLSSATVVVAGGFLSGDMLNYASLTGLGIVGSYDTATGTLTLSGSASVANYQAALASVTYSFAPAGGDPSNGGSDAARTIDWLVKDGVAASNTGLSSLSVNGPSPVLGGTSGTVANFIQQGSPVALDSAVTLTDGDSTTLASATVVITGGFLPSDTLAAVTSGTAITALYSNGTLTLSGTDTLAHYQQVLRSLTYSSTATDPTGGGSDFSRTITWQVNDGRGANDLSNIGTTTVDTHVRPVMIAGTTVTFATGSGAVLVEPGLGVADADTNQIVTGTVAIGTGLLSGDVLAFNNGTDSESFGDGATISASFNAVTGSLVFGETGSQASAADWQQALQSVTFNNAGANPTSSGADPTRTLTWTLNTGNPNQTSVAVTSTIDLLPAPVISGTVSGQTTTDESAIDPFSGVRVTDANAGQTETVTITLSSAANGTLSNLGGGTFNNGTYVVTGTALDVTAAVDGLVFTPTAHQVAPGDTVATGFTIGVVDSAHAASSDSSTSVIATAVNDPPTITEAVDHTGVPNENSASPFGVLTVSDPDVGHTDTLTVTLSDPAGGTLSNLSGGSFNAATGVYTISGSAAQLTAALAALVFTPVPPADGSATATTQFTVSVAGPGGSATDTSISVTAVAQQVPGITNPATSNTISISPDGSGFTPATAGQTNEAVVSDPSAGGSYALPDGYQAAFLGGNADATLTDNAVGGAVLVGNSGNDTISAGANDDTLVGGSGDNTFRASGTSDVIGVTGVSTVSTSGSRDTVFAGAGALTLNDSGSGDAIGLSSGSANVTLSGGGASVFANTGSLSLVDDGTRDMIGGGSGPISATLGGSGSSVYGGSGALALDVASTASDAVIGTGRSDATITVAGSAATVYGGAGNLSADVLGDNAVIGLDGGTTALTLAGSAAKVFGGSGDLSVVDLGHGDTIGAGTGATTVRGGGSGAVVVGGGGDLTFVGGADEATVVGGSGSTTVIGGTGAMTLYGSAGGTLTYADGSGAITYQAGLGNETLQASGATSGAVINGGIDASGHDVLIGGAGNDSLFAGTGSATLSGGGGNNEFVFYKSVIAGNAPHDVITDFNANDTVYLAGYGSGEAVRDLSSATSSGGSTTITLSDNTRITFTNVSSANLLSGHIVSF